MTKQWLPLAVVSVLLLAMLPAAAQLRTRPEQPGQGYGPNYIPEGTRFVVRLDDKLETAKLQEGKHFKAKLAEDLVAANGDSIPRGKKIKGHVSRVNKGLHAGMMLSFDEIETRHGWMPLAAVVTGAPGDHALKTNAEGEVEKTGVSKKRVAEGAVAGAGAGAGTGAVVAGAHGAVVGAAVGAVVGGTTGLLTDRNLKLDKGQQLEVQLERPLEVPAN
jgi:hypothetical protein